MSLPGGKNLGPFAASHALVSTYEQAQEMLHITVNQSEDNKVNIRNIMDQKYTNRNYSNRTKNLHFYRTTSQ